LRWAVLTGPHFQPTFGPASARWSRLGA
jgi:hypothetical protein